MNKKIDAGVETDDQGAPLDSGVETDEDSQGSDENKDNSDYKALYEKELQEKENYKNALNQKRQLRNKSEDVEEDDTEDVEETKISKAVRKELAPLIGSITGNKVEQTLNSLTKDPAKQKLVKFYYDNRIVRTGTSDDSIRNDLEAALNMADGAKLRRENSELKRANQNKDTVSMAGGGADRGTERNSHGFSEAQVAELTKKANRLGADPKKFIEQSWRNRPSQ